MSSTPKAPKPPRPPRPPKPDQLRQRYNKPPLQLPVCPGTVNVQTSTPGAAPKTNGNIILQDALKEIGEQARETIENLLRPENTVDVDEALSKVHTCAGDLQERCRRKKLSWTYKGRQVYLSEKMDKILQFLDRLKAVGDIVANVDPIHVGLPWAGVRAILEVRVSRETSFSPVLTL
jgi:hypothetical protein